MACARRGWCSQNPCKQVDRPPKNRDAEIRFLDETELEALLREVPDDHLGAMERVLYLTAATAGVPMRTLQEWMGHRDFKTTLIYADYAPSAHEHALVELAFGPRGINRGINLSATAVTPDDRLSDKYRQFEGTRPPSSGCGLQVVAGSSPVAHPS